MSTIIRLYELIVSRTAVLFLYITHFVRCLIHTATELTIRQWVYFIIQDLSFLDAFHPLHLHGHDFYVLSQGSGTFITGVTPVNLINPPRRDTAILPGNGHIVLAFETNNPGYVKLHFIGTLLIETMSWRFGTMKPC